MRTREETEAFIAEVTSRLNGPVNCIERALLVADRKEARAYLATLPVPSDTGS
jgi:hypothetical protein